MRNRIIKIIIILVAIISAIYIAKNKDVIKENIPIKILIVKSNSMYPVLSKNDVIVIKEFDDYDVGDIVTYNYNNSYLITHRVSNKTEYYYKTKGDNNNTEDNNVVEIKDIKGKIIFVINKIQQIVLVILLIILIILIFYL